MFNRKKGDPIFREAAKTFSAEDYAKTVELCAEALREGIKTYDPALVYATYGYSLTKVGREKEAMEVHEKAVKLNPENPVAWRYYGMSLRQTNEFDKAERCYERGLTIDPNDEFTLASLGALYIFRNKPQKAIEILAPFVEAGGQAGLTMSNLALAYGMVGDFDSAQEALGKAVQKGYPRWKHLQERINAMRSYRESLNVETSGEWLPENCPKCGAPAYTDNVQWVSKSSVICGYCGSTMKKKTNQPDRS